MDKIKDFTASLTLGSDGAAWTGTFGVLVRALAADLLPEGPVIARVRAFDGPTVTGQWTAIEGANVVVGGQVIDIEDIEEIAIG